MGEGRKFQKLIFKTRLYELGAHGGAYKIKKLRKLVDFFSPAQLLPPRNIYEQT